MINSVAPHSRPKLRVFIPQDSIALALGANHMAQQVAAWAQRRQIEVELVRNGSRGLLWLEPLLEVQALHQPDAPRLAFGPMSTDALDALLAEPQWFLGLPHHPLYLGNIETHPYLAQQERLSFKRIGLHDPTNLEAYQEQGGGAGLRLALACTPDEVIDSLIQSGLRGRGGAAFPTGIKWQTVAQSPAAQKFIVCNADEGDAGGFSDRLALEADPFALIEGMLIAGWAVGAQQGFIYIRSEYPRSLHIIEQALQRARASGWLGKNILGSDFSFELQIFKGAGAYICGEETALLESMEGKVGLVRSKPPLPAHQGYLGQPTVVNNVVTLTTVPVILAQGADYYADFGSGRSRGTLAFQLSGNIKQPGLIEKAFGLSLRQLIEDYGGGTLSGRSIKTIQVGGPLGTYLPPKQWDTPLDYEAFAAIGGLLGHGGIIVFDEQINIPALAQHAMRFCADESCGKCTPCRIGSVRAVEILGKLDGLAPDYGQQKALLLELCETMEQASLCALGGMAPYPVRSLIEHYEADFKGNPQ